MLTPSLIKNNVIFTDSWAFYVIVTHDLQKMAALLIGVIDWTIALGGG